MKKNFRSLVTAALLTTSFALVALPQPVLANPNACRLLMQKGDVDLVIQQNKQREYVSLLLKGQPSVPAMLKDTPKGQIPVILLTGQTQPALNELLDESMGTIVALQPGYKNDHGQMRVAQNVIDVDLPGARGFGETNRTGIAWKPLPSYLARKMPGEANSYTWFEVGYLLTPAEKVTAKVYQAMRRAAIIRVPFSFGGNKTDMTQNNMLSSGEHCFIFCKASAVDSHVNEMRQKIQAAGIRDVNSFMQSPEVTSFYNAAANRLLSIDPAQGNPNSILSADLVAIINPVLPVNMTLQERGTLINWIFGLEATSRYQALRNSLGMTSEMSWRDASTSNRASFILVYGKTTDAAAFRAGTYTSPGVFNSWTAQGQAPLK